MGRCVPGQTLDRIRGIEELTDLRVAVVEHLQLGDLLEGIVLHAFEGKTPFGAETLRKITELKAIYELDLDARSSHRLREKP